MHIVLEIVAAVLIAAGLLGLCWLAFGRLLAPVGKADRSMAVVPASGDGEGLEQEVRGLLWLKSGNMAKFTVVIADCGLNDRGRTLAALLQEWEPALVCCKAEELGRYIQGKQ